MDQATQATTPTASTPTSEQAAQRAAYQRASAAADRIVDRLTVLPHDVEARGERGSYSIRLHFGAGITAGRGVLEVAGIADAEPTCDPSGSGLGIWIECRAKVDGIPLVARALVTQENADRLLQATPAPAATAPEATPPTAATPAAQSVPLGTSVIAHVPAVTPVTPVGGDV